MGETSVYTMQNTKVLHKNPHYYLPNITLLYLLQRM